MVLKCARDNVKTCGLFAQDWPEWISVEMVFQLDLDWVCLKESTFFFNLALLYPTVTFISWGIGVTLPPVNFVFCSQWIPPLTREVWKCETLRCIKFALSKSWIGWQCPLQSHILMLEGAQPRSGSSRTLLRPRISW
jgi:hypothetical protein